MMGKIKWDKEQVLLRMKESISYGTTGSNTAQDAVAGIFARVKERGR